MQWKGRRESENVEDRRGIPAKGLAIGGGIGGLILLLVVVLLGGDPRMLMQQQPQPGEAGQQPGPGPGGKPAVDDEGSKFVRVVLADTEDVWNAQFKKLGKTYREPKLVLFSGQVKSACGFASAAVGPFYCPEDEKLYIDLQFFEELRSRFKAPGDFAQAYVIAHEVGHHVQNLLGITDQVQSQRARLSKSDYNKLSVRLELQADFFAGVWAHHAQKMNRILDPGDLEEALRAANAIGDDRLQKEQQGYVVPDSFTHGTSEQRIRWFRHGFQTGDINKGDTFRMPDP